MRRCMLSMLSVALLLGVTLQSDSAAQHFGEEPKQPKSDQPNSKRPEWKSLFDGKTLNGWKKAQFGGDGAIDIEEGTITMDFGSYLTGITYQGKLPKTNYELSLEGKRVDGIDFFCATTFPVADSYCTLVVGGWAGAVVGLSNLDGLDASQNETTKYLSFETDRWYHVRIRVQPERIQAWIDDKQVVDVNIKGRRIETRPEVDLSKPLGIAAWETRAALRNIRIRELPAQQSQGGMSSDM